MDKLPTDKILVSEQILPPCALHGGLECDDKNAFPFHFSCLDSTQLFHKPERLDAASVVTTLNVVVVVVVVLQAHFSKTRSEAAFFPLEK